MFSIPASIDCMKLLKHRLFESCLAFLDTRVTTLTEAIQEAQHSANTETKSSAGDKYETGRAMAQLEIEKLSAQLAEALKLKHTLSQISPDIISPQVRTGSLVFTSRGNFYIAVHAGTHQLDNQSFFAISPDAPIAQKLMGLTTGDIVSLHHHEFTILELQ